METINIIIILIILLVLFLFINSECILEIENFDEKVTGSTKVNCGIMCTKLTNCKGFMVNKNNDTCYLSKTQILGSPTSSVFSNEYDSKLERCNKYDNITDTVIATDLDKKKNATYICTPNQTDNQQEYRIYDNSEKIIHSLDDLKYINVDEYSFLDIDWNKKITLGDYPKLISNPDPYEKKNIETLTEYTNEHLGQYMFDHKCSANISQHDCVKFCLNNSDCVGIEWNPTYTPKISSGEYELHRNVCCPKRLIVKIIPRREEFKNGNFYLKEKILASSIASNSIVNFDKK